jgi:hypothetical protein
VTPKRAPASIALDERFPRDQTFASEDELRRVTHAYAVAELALTWDVSEQAIREAPVLPSSSLYASDDNREARDIYKRLQSAVRDAIAFAEKHNATVEPNVPRGGMDAYANLLRWWGPAFQASPLAISLVFLPLEYEELPDKDAELTNLVRWWDEELKPFRAPDSDRVRALMALRAGWWPTRASFVPTRTPVREVVDLARRGVKEARKALRGK